MRRRMCIVDFEVCGGGALEEKDVYVDVEVVGGSWIAGIDDDAIICGFEREDDGKAKEDGDSGAVFVVWDCHFMVAWGLMWPVSMPWDVVLDWGCVSAHWKMFRLRVTGL